MKKFFKKTIWASFICFYFLLSLLLGYVFFVGFCVLIYIRYLCFRSMVNDGHVYYVSAWCVNNLIASR